MSLFCTKRRPALFVLAAAAVLLLVGAGPRTAAAQCQLDASKSPVANDGTALVNFQDITKGSGASGVTVIEYFDPNCPHCKDFHQTMKKVVADHREDVRFVYKPFPLRRSSLPEVQALYVAAQSDKFGAMLEGQYAQQARSGISMSDLRAVASDIGMDPTVLANRIEEGAYQPYILEQRKRAVGVGVDSTPTVLVNGHFVKTRTQQCLNAFIEQAQSGTLGASASK